MVNPLHVERRRHSEIFCQNFHFLSLALLSTAANWSLIILIIIVNALTFLCAAAEFWSGFLFEEYTTILPLLPNGY